MTENEHNSLKKNKHKKIKKRKIRWHLVLITILVLGIIGVGTGAGIVYSYIKDAPPINMDNFVYMEPSVILDKNGDFYQELQGKEKEKLYLLMKSLILFKRHLFPLRMKDLKNIWG